MFALHFYGFPCYLDVGKDRRSSCIGWNDFEDDCFVQATSLDASLPFCMIATGKVER